MTSANTNMQAKDGNPAGCKCQHHIQQLEHDVTEKEDELMFWYRQFEDAKEEARLMSSATNSEAST